jgi:hypothetical protein
VQVRSGLATGFPDPWITPVEYNKFPTAPQMSQEIYGHPSFLPSWFTRIQRGAIVIDRS